MTAVVETTDVSRRYGETVALDGVSLAVETGEVFGLIGPNGAGKTTLVRAILGTTVVDGDVAVFGQSPDSVDRDRIGLLPQDFDPPGRLTPRELLRYYGGLYDEAREPDTLLRDVGIGREDAGRPYENLSGGQQRRTCVATALVNDPDLLVLDEPTTGIDPAGRRALWDLIDGLAAGGTTVLLTTHYMAEAQTLADRVALLSAGSVVAMDTPEQLVATHGGESLLRFENVGAPADGDPETAVSGTLGADLAYDAEAVDGRLLVREVPPRDIGEVVAALEAAGVTYESLTWTEPDLEDVYLALTGEWDEGAVAGGAVAGGERGRGRTRDDDTTGTETRDDETPDTEPGGGPG
jgi:ABC-2 type transport system ATP-binding protein